MSVRTGAAARLCSRASRLASVALAAATLGGCAAPAPRDTAQQPATLKSATAAANCDARAVAGAPKIDRRQAEALRAQVVTFCEVTVGANGSESFQTGRTVVEERDGRDFIPLIAFEDGPLPSGCDVSTDTRLFLLIESRWVEARQVGCGADS